jgi:hypothetical protein
LSILQCSFFKDDLELEPNSCLQGRTKTFSSKDQFPASLDSAFSTVGFTPQLVDYHNTDDRDWFISGLKEVVVAMLEKLCMIMCDGSVLTD